MKVQFSSKRYLLIISICMIIGIYFLWPIISNDTQKIHVSDSSLVQTEMQTLGEESFDDTQLEKQDSSESTTSSRLDDNNDGMKSGKGQKKLSQNNQKLASYLVYISGAVQNPGLYALEGTSTTADIIKTAGGLLPYAGTDGINMADTVKSGAHIHIPFNYSGNPELLLRKPKININTATVEELKSLPGIGDAMAKRIEEYRQTQGQFTSIEDIKKIKGIGDAMFKKLGDKISVS